MSTASGRALPPAFSISSAAEKMVPGNLGWGSVVLAAMATLAPSAAARRAMALPMPREAPVMNKVLPFKSAIGVLLGSFELRPALRVFGQLSVRLFQHFVLGQEDDAHVVHVRLAEPRAVDHDDAVVEDHVPYQLDVLERPQGEAGEV